LSLWQMAKPLGGTSIGNMVDWMKRIYTLPLSEAVIRRGGHPGAGLEMMMMIILIL
jgi:hypothetical protein